MQRDEAKQLLELCRPGNETDRQDTALAEAFALLETDAELCAWFEAQQATDARISESLNSLEAPADLKASILAGMRLHQANAAAHASENSVVFPQEQDASLRRPPQRTWWRQPWIGIAALLAIAMVFFSLPESESDAPDSTTLAGLPPVIQFLSREIDSLQSWQFDKRDESPENLKAYLASHQAPTPRAIPDCLSKMPSLGCITFEYEATKLSMICFKNGNVYHLITANKSTYPDPLPEKPSLFECKDKAFRIWVDGDQVKILTVHGTKEDIPEII